jgi:hypothetical protein
MNDKRRCSLNQDETFVAFSLGGHGTFSLVGVINEQKNSSERIYYDTPSDTDSGFALRRADAGEAQRLYYCGCSHSRFGHWSKHCDLQRGQRHAPPTVAIPQTK